MERLFRNGGKERFKIEGRGGIPMGSREPGHRHAPAGDLHLLTCLYSIQKSGKVSLCLGHAQTAHRHHMVI